MAARERLAFLANIPLLEVTETASALADRLVRRGTLPPKAAFDALHIAISAANGLEYLLTWNCRHIANAALRPTIEDTCREAGFEPPIMCTPEELLNG